MTIETNHSEFYSTADTALAAWLYSQGFVLVDVDASGFPSIFRFENSDPKLQKYARDFQVGRAVGNIAVFYRAYKKLLSIIKTGGTT